MKYFVPELRPKDGGGWVLEIGGEKIYFSPGTPKAIAMHYLEIANMGYYWGRAEGAKKEADRYRKIKHIEREMDEGYNNKDDLK